MRNFQKSGKFSRMIQSKTFLIFLGVIILFFFFSMFSLMSRMEETIKNKKITEDRIAELEKSKNKLNSDIAKLKTDEGVESNIRDKFGLAKEGENMILIVDDKSPVETSKDAESTSLWSIFKGWFK